MVAISNPFSVFMRVKGGGACTHYITRHGKGLQVK